jgi:hypothetical protein
MEIIEIISYEINKISDTIKVKFRMNEDSDDETRVDEVELKEADDFGYVLITEDFGFYDDESNEDEFFNNNDIDEHELKLFLNEYYMIYSERIPEKE